VVDFPYHCTFSVTPGIARCFVTDWFWELFVRHGACLYIKLAEKYRSARRNSPFRKCDSRAGAILDTVLLPFIRDARGGSYGKRNWSILSGGAYSPDVDHSSRSVCNRPPARWEISPLNPIATKPQRRRQTKRRSRRFLLQSKFDYPYQQICQAVSREHYRSIGNPSRANNVACRKHGSRLSVTTAGIVAFRALNPKGEVAVSLS